MFQFLSSLKGQVGCEAKILLIAFRHKIIAIILKKSKGNWSVALRSNSNILSEKKPWIISRII